MRVTYAHCQIPNRVFICIKIPPLQLDLLRMVVRLVKP